MSQKKRNQPVWNAPQTSEDTANVPTLYNSLTRSKTEFKPVSGNKRVNWYNCGPTVYDSSHMGHARSYITFDIIRRVLRDYFNFDIFFVQNVTDIDDKIIRRARQQHLFSVYRAKIVANEKTSPTVLADVKAALEALEAKLSKEEDADKKVMLAKMLEAGKQGLAQNSEHLLQLVDSTQEMLSTYLDVNFGHQVTDNSIFTSLPRRFEADYNEDMWALGILPPDAVTRVSEYIPEIVKYIEKIISNGFAYESNGSVYFDTQRFATSGKNFYAKLVPEAVGDATALAEGEGDLAAANAGEEKRNASDFALWKASKPGEPAWLSPWGQGRPGWHIECSVMASELIEGPMDIHSGGIDLRFPHHDNEIAQAEAYYNNGEPWVYYFLHSGHLTISGCKMSKSLKNFITIKQALKANTARQLRLAFLLHSWKDTLDYSDNTMNDAVLFEKMLLNFFGTVKDIAREYNKQAFENQAVKWADAEKQLNQAYGTHVSAIDRALRDNIDTKTVCEEVRALVGLANKYLEKGKVGAGVSLLTSIATYLTKLFDMFGCNSTGSAATDKIGFAVSSEASAGGEEQLLPFVDIIVDLRAELRRFAMQMNKEDGQQLLALGDAIRDERLPLLGVRIEDYNEEGMLKTRIKFDDKDQLRKEMEERQREKEAREKAKIEKKAQAEAKKAEIVVSPAEFFKLNAQYSKFDENGRPTHDAQGEEISKSGQKKVDKIWALQEKKYNAYLARQNS